VLLGLAEDPEICRIFEKLRLSKILSDLVRAGPVSEQALMRHQAFREYTLVLISKVSGKAEAGLATNDAMDPVTLRLEKAGIVAETTLAYDQQQLLGLIRDHLVGLGLDRSAAMLTSEANLPPYSKLPAGGPASAVRLSRHYDSPSSHAVAAATGTATTPLKSALQQQQPGTKRRRQSRSSSVGLHAIEELMQSPEPVARQTSSSTGSRSKRIRKGSRCESPALSEASASSSAKPVTRRVTRLSAAREASLLVAAQATPSAAALKRAAWKAPSYFDAKLQDSTPSAARPLSSSRRAVSSSAMLPGESLPATQRPSRGRPKSPAVSFHHAKSLQHRPHEHTLHSMVLSFLRSQHAQCSHPVAVLPPLDLVREHRCPAPPVSSNSIADALEARRLALSTRRVDIDRTVSRYIHARLRYWRHYKEGGSMLTACAFGHDKRKLYLSNHLGQLITFDPWTLQSEGPWDVGSVASIVTSRRADAPMMMTCSFTSQYALFDPEIVCRVWREGQFVSPTWEIGEMFKPSFNTSVTKACGFRYNPGSLEHSPVILDLATGVLTVLEDQLVARHASFDQPTCVFDANDELLLASGNLWDLRTNWIVHRFDRLTKAGDGTFHPNGNEVLIDGNIWDVRTHRLLRTIPLLDKSIVRFNGTGDVIYAFQPPPMNITSRRLNTSDQALRIIDAADYTEVQSIHTDGTVMHQIDVDPSDQYLALIDCTFGQPPDSVCKIFEVRPYLLLRNSTFVSLMSVFAQLFVTG
jgi:HIV-1 Vpr-binding protein